MIFTYLKKVRRVSTQCFTQTKWLLRETVVEILGISPPAVRARGHALRRRIPPRRPQNHELPGSGRGPGVHQKIDLATGPDTHMAYIHTHQIYTYLYLVYRLFVVVRVAVVVQACSLCCWGLCRVTLFRHEC